MKIAVKSAAAGLAVVVAAAFGAPMAHAVADTDAAHSGSHTSQPTQRKAPKFEPNTKTSRQWGPSQFGSATSGGWAP